jgi:hypothetical protein
MTILRNAIAIATQAHATKRAAYLTGVAAIVLGSIAFAGAAQARDNVQFSVQDGSPGYSPNHGYPVFPPPPPLFMPPPPPVPVPPPLAVLPPPPLAVLPPPPPVPVPPPLAVLPPPPPLFMPPPPPVPVPPPLAVVPPPPPLFMPPPPPLPVPQPGYAQPGSVVYPAPPVYYRQAPVTYGSASGGRRGYSNNDGQGRAHRYNRSKHNRSKQNRGGQYQQPQQGQGPVYYQR